MLINSTTKMALNSSSGAISLTTNSSTSGQNIYIVSSDLPFANHQDQIALGSGGGKQLLTLSSGHMAVNGT